MSIRQTVPLGKVKVNTFRYIPHGKILCYLIDMDKYENRRERLSLLIATQLKGSKAELARKLGISESYVSRMLYPGNRAGGKRIGEEMADKISKAFGLPPGWLDRPNAEDAGADLSNVGAIFDESGSLRYESLIRAIHPEDPKDQDIVYVPESRIEFSAGNGKLHYELVEDDDPATYRLSWFQKNHMNPGRVRRFRVAGDSQEPMLFDGDIVLVNLDETHITDGKLYAIRYGDELRVKYLSRRLDGTLVLRSINPAYKDEEIPPQVVEKHISIIGRVRDKSGKGGL